MSANSNLRAAAFHEAGHAVYRYLHTGYATALQIGPDGSGYSHGSGQVVGTVQAIEIIFAGPVAEARARHTSLLYVLLNGGRDDYLDAEARLDAHGWKPIESREILWSAEKVVRREIRVHWRAVERLAEAALASEHGMLSAAEVSTLMEEYVTTLEADTRSAA